MRKTHGKEGEEGRRREKEQTRYVSFVGDFPSCYCVGLSILPPPPSFRHRLRTVFFLSSFLRQNSYLGKKAEKRKRHFCPPLFSSFLPSGWGRPHKSMFLPSLPPPPRSRRGGNSQFHGITFCCTVCGEKGKEGRRPVQDFSQAIGHGGQTHTHKTEMEKCGDFLSLFSILCI